ncbi:hypothetical protein EH223_05735 [candidate division KSB1 bacterium]|nr:hypothetical protein [candidate division KSB1 bacterium]RQW05103.1 MAG: hypothetical protein EH223_05735 [candidate division KSB1 bacterium]
MSLLSIHDVKKKYEEKIMNIPGVIGIGIGKQDDLDAITVLVVERTPLIEKKVPKKLKQFPVIIRETGVIRAL